ncbi:MAG: twin-arginine translocation signal domain-containing protein [Bacteroidota bacterium]
MKRRNFLKTAGAGSAALTGLAAIQACTQGAGTAQKISDPEGLKLLNETPLRAEMDIEPTLAEAVNYWQDMDGTYTSLGWPDNMTAVSLLWNGGIVAKPDLNRRTTQYKDQGAFFRFIPTTMEKLNKEGAFASAVDFDSYFQGDAFKEADKLATDDHAQMDYYRSLGYFSETPKAYADKNIQQS